MKFIEKLKSKSSLSKKNESQRVLDAGHILKEGFKMIKKEQLFLGDEVFPPGGIKLLVSRIIQNASIVLEGEGLTIDEAFPNLSEEIRDLNRDVTVKTLEVACRLSDAEDVNSLAHTFRKAINAVQDIDLEKDTIVKKLFEQYFSESSKNHFFGLAVINYLDEEYDSLQNADEKVSNVELEVLIRVSKVLEIHVLKYPGILTEQFRRSYERCFSQCNTMYERIYKEEYCEEKRLYQNWMKYMQSVRELVISGGEVTHEIIDNLRQIHSYIEKTPESNRSSINELIISYNNLKRDLDN